MSDRSFFALFKRATKRAIALSLFSKERPKERLLFRSFKKSDPSFKESDRSFALSKRAKISKKWAIFQIANFLLKKKNDRSFSKWANAQPWCIVYKLHRSGWPLEHQRKIENNDKCCKSESIHIYKNYTMAFMSYTMHYELTLIVNCNSIFCSYIRSIPTKVSFPGAFSIIQDLRKKCGGQGPPTRHLSLFRQLLFYNFLSTTLETRILLKTRILHWRNETLPKAT